jgi:hypothetical protein
MVTAVRTFLIFLVVVGLLLAAIGGFLIATTPRQTAGIRYPLGERERTLIAQIPAAAEAFAVIPTAAALDGKLRANPMTRSAVDTWRANQHLPRPWMIGGADLLAWKSGDETRYLLRLDPFRAFLVRTYAMLGGNIGSTLLINPPAEQTFDSAEISRIADWTSKLPAGDALVVQFGRSGFPPLERPAATSVQVGQSEIFLTSVGAAVPGRPGAGERPAATRFPRSAILTASFTTPPRVINDLNRIFAAKVSTLLEKGGMVALYGMQSRTLLPRPLGVIVLPADEERRVALDKFSENLKVAELIGVHLRRAEVGNTLVLSFDDSIDQYLKDASDPAPDAGSQWQVRIDPPRLVQILNEIDESVGLRIAAPRLFRSARDLERWIGGLEQAKVIEATDSVDSGRETLQVRIRAK